MMRLCGMVLFLMVSFARPGVAQEAPFDDPLAELAALGDAVAELSEVGGTSIRAKRGVTIEGDDPREMQAKVEAVRQGKFPVAAIRVRVVKPAKDGPGQSMKSNDQLVLLPQFGVAGGKVQLGDDASIENAGAYFLQKGDKVSVRLDKQQKGNVWLVTSVRRK
jgi:hypothetical protein